MRRTLLASLLISVASTACVVGDQTPGVPDHGNPGAGPDAAGDPTPAPDAGSTQAVCEPPSAVIPDGHHNPGQDCLTCHNGTTATKWTMAGTLYDTATGTNPVSGGTIIVTDNGGTVIKLVSASNGNFYTGRAVQFPITVKASRCPDTQTMTSAQQVGDCNSCHGAQSRVHLP